MCVEGVAWRCSRDGCQQVPGRRRHGRRRALTNDRNVQTFPWERPTDVAQVLRHFATSQLCHADLLSGTHSHIQELVGAQTRRHSHAQEQISDWAWEAPVCCITGLCQTIQFVVLPLSTNLFNGYYSVAAIIIIIVIVGSINLLNDHMHFRHLMIRVCPDNCSFSYRCALWPRVIVDIRFSCLAAPEKVQPILSESASDEYTKLKVLHFVINTRVHENTFILWIEFYWSQQKCEKYFIEEFACALHCEP